MFYFRSTWRWHRRSQGASPTTTHARLHVAHVGLSVVLMSFNSAASPRSLGYVAHVSSLSQLVNTTHRPRRRSWVKAWLNFLVRIKGKKQKVLRIFNLFESTFFAMKKLKILTEQHHVNLKPRKKFQNNWCMWTWDIPPIPSSIHKYSTSLYAWCKMSIQDWKILKKR